MPAITSGKVLVTGANGYVAIWVVDTLLKQGYSVRATVRSADKGTHLTQTFAAYGDKLEIVVVKDITKVNTCYHKCYASDTIAYSYPFFRKERSTRPSRV